VPDPLCSPEWGREPFWFLFTKSSKGLDKQPQVVQIKVWRVGLNAKISIDASIQYRQNLVKEVIRSLSNGLGPTCSVINGFDLLYHDKSGHMRILSNGYMEWITPIRAGQGADDAEAGLFVE